MVAMKDGPSSSNFYTIPLKGNINLGEIAEHKGISETMIKAVTHVPSGECVAWGIPFKIDDVVLIDDHPVTIELNPVTAQWLIFMHTSDMRPLETKSNGFHISVHGQGRLNELAATYVMIYEDGSEINAEIRRRHQIGSIDRWWGENCFQAVAHHKPHPLRSSHEQLRQGWGWTQTRVDTSDSPEWTNWLWAWENPNPEKPIKGIRFDPASGIVIISALTGGTASEQPFRWRRRRKAILKLPAGTSFLPDLDEDGLLTQVQLDMGQVISALPRLDYPNDGWEESYNNQVPPRLESEVLVEYTSHPDACFHLWSGEKIPVIDVEKEQLNIPLQPVAPAHQRVLLRVIDQKSKKQVAVKLHVHGEGGEYLPPVDRHRMINTAWFEDYSVDFSHQGTHQCTYISGETTLDLPLGKVFIEISKGFEIRPVRKIIEITADTEEIVIELEKVLNWRENGWVTADTHVHFLSPVSARLEGAGEGVNIINLLASQWGELMTNVGDFDGQTTWGSREAGGDGEYLVRVGTENRQHVLGHISLLGYRGSIIAPMTTGGPDESAIGDPIEILLTEWARQCKRQGGVVVLPHFAQPRAEHAASIISGDIDALEMTSWGDLYSGINPYSLADWYRYLNCGYLVAAVGGTDKMSSNTAVGTVRTYAHIPEGQPFTYGAWMEAIRQARTFVTYGPLLEFQVNNQPMGNRFDLPSTGATLDVSWKVASVTIPMTRVELIINGEIRESHTVDLWEGSGHWSIKTEKSSWMALLVRGQYHDKPEIIAAHSSPVMIHVEGSQLLAAADGVTILEQIEGALAYLDTVGTRAEDRAYKRMRLVLESAHRTLHNRMHHLGYYHDHSPVEDHADHHR